MRGRGEAGGGKEALKGKAKGAGSQAPPPSWLSYRSYRSQRFLSYSTWKRQLLSHTWEPISAFR